MTLHRDAFGERVAARWQIGTLQAIVHRRHQGRLHTDDLDRWLDRLGGNGDARNQTAATNGHHDDVQVRHGREHLKRDRALAGDDQRIVVGMNECVAVLGCFGVRKTGAVFQGGAGDDHRRSVVLGILDLYRRRADRHHDRCGNSQTLGVVGDTLRMVASRHRDDPRFALRERQMCQPVARAAFLEGSGELQVLELQPGFATEQFRERAAVIEVGDQNFAVDDARRLLDIGKRDLSGRFDLDS